MLATKLIRSSGLLITGLREIKSFDDRAGIIGCSRKGTVCAPTPLLTKLFGEPTGFVPSFPSKKDEWWLDFVYHHPMEPKRLINVPLALYKDQGASAKIKVPSWAIATDPIRGTRDPERPGVIHQGPDAHAIHVMSGEALETVIMLISYQMAVELT